MSQPHVIECPNCSTSLVASKDWDKDHETTCPNCKAVIVAPVKGGIQPTNTSITTDFRSTQGACLSCFLSCTPTRRARQTKSRSKKLNSSSFRLVLLRTPGFKMFEGHNVPNGVFEALFGAAEKASVLKPRERFVNSLIW
jgi:hypothetical protein